MHKDFQGQGTATIIANELEKYALQKRIMVVTTEASITAKTFFEKRGYQEIKKQSIAYYRQTLINFVMKKHLAK